MALRLFLGVFPPLAIIESLEESLTGISAPDRGFRWTEPSQRHVTLFFLGDTPEERVEGLKQRTAWAVRDVPSFGAVLKGLDGFPNLRFPKVLFVHARAQGEGWARLTGALRPELTALGFALETKPFQPHLTLARVKDPQAVESLLSSWSRSLENFEAQWNVDRFCLVSSHLGPQGAQYESLETYQLKKAE